MADRQAEKKESNVRIPVVTPDRRRSTEDSHREDSHRQYNNPRDYKANFKWNNPYSLLGQTDQPIKRATPNKTEETRNETGSQNKNRRRKLKMTDDEKITVSAKELKEEMNWNNKANKTPTILEVLEFKADLIEGLRQCTYRGNKQGHTFLI